MTTDVSERLYIPESLSQIKSSISDRKMLTSYLLDRTGSSVVISSFDEDSWFAIDASVALKSMLSIARGHSWTSKKGIGPLKRSSLFCSAREDTDWKARTCLLNSEGVDIAS